MKRLVKADSMELKTDLTNIKTKVNEINTSLRDIENNLSTNVVYEDYEDFSNKIVDLKKNFETNNTILDELINKLQ